MASWYVCIFLHYFEPQPSDTFLIFEDVQAFSVWEKDAKDASGFVGYCYLDLFPRGMHFSPSLTLSV
jgi:hypothetical protein